MESISMSEDRRALLAVALVLISVPMVFPSSLWPPILLVAVVVGILVFLYNDNAKTTLNERHERHERLDGTDKSKTINVSPIDPSLYTLKMLNSGGSIHSLRKTKQAFKHLSLRKGGSLVDKVHRAALLGSKNGNNGSGTKAMAALEDFFSRYHRALMSSSPELAQRTLEVLRDTRVVALNAIEDLAFTVPIALSAPVRIASEAVRSETLECMSTLVLKHSPSMSPSLRASMSQWASPRPHDPIGVVGDPHQLY